MSLKKNAGMSHTEKSPSPRRPAGWKAQYYVWAIRPRGAVGILFVGLGARQEVRDYWKRVYADAFMNDKTKFSQVRAMIHKIPSTQTLYKLDEFETFFSCNMFLSNFRRQYPQIMIADCRRPGLAVKQPLRNI